MQFYSIIHPRHDRIKGKVISVIGGGGKTSFINRAARELADLGLRVIVTSTTKLQAPADIPLLLTADPDTFGSDLRGLLKEVGIVVIAKKFYREDRLLGVPKVFISELKKVADVILIEADGTRQKPLKTHKDYEPVIPLITDMVVVVCGAEIVGQQLNEDNVHRSELFSQKWSLPLGTLLTPEVISKELLSPYSYLRYVPLRSRVIFFINKSDLNSIGGRLLAEHIVKKCDYHVYFGSLKNGQIERITIENI
jgi:probable selenium-dependent hydroxylase accessory protein YqeC